MLSGRFRSTLSLKNGRSGGRHEHRDLEDQETNQRPRVRERQRHEHDLPHHAATRPGLPRHQDARRRVRNRLQHQVPSQPPVRPLRHHLSSAEAEALQQSPHQRARPLHRNHRERRRQGEESHVRFRALQAH